MSASDYTSRESVDAVVRKLTDWNWLAEIANNGWNLPPHGTDALVMLTGRAAAMLDALAKERDAAWASANAYKIDLANSRLREAKATPLRAPMSQGGRIVYDPNHKE